MFTRFFQSWGLEVSALASSLGIAGAMVGLLARFNNQSVFEWNGITLNTSISILSVVMKALLLFSAAECIGQWKWIILHRSRTNLIDFERIDQASRGPLGCLNLTWRRGMPPMLRMGMVVVVLTIAMDPFSQQLLRLRQRIKWTEGDRKNFDKSAKIFWAWGYRELVSFTTDDFPLSADFDEEASRNVPQIDLSMEAAILNALGRSQDSIEQQSLAFCPTGNCTWPTVSTLGVCSRCSNLTSQLERVDGFDGFFHAMWNWTHPDPVRNATAYVLPRGHFLANTNGCTPSSGNCYMGKDLRAEYYPYQLTAYSTGNWNNTITLQDVNTLITSMSVIYVAGNRTGVWPNVPVAALECGLYFCVKEIKEAHMERNELLETATEAKDWGRMDPERKANEPSGELPTLEYDPSNSGFTSPDLVMNQTSAESTYLVRGQVYQAISRFFNHTLAKNWDNGEVDLLRVAKRLDPNIEHMFNAAVVGKDLALPKKLDGICNITGPVELEAKFERIASSMTNDMRRQGLFRNAQHAFGRAGVLEISYSVVWPWFALHTAIIGGSVIFCVTTMVASRSVPVWKSHSLATMSQGATVIDFGPEAKSLVELEKSAKVFQVSLAGGEEGHLMRRRDDISTRDDASGTEEDLCVSTGKPSVSQ